MNEQQSNEILSSNLALNSAIQLLFHIVMASEADSSRLPLSEVIQMFARMADREAEAMHHTKLPLPPDRRDAVIFAAQQQLTGLVVAAGNRLLLQPPNPQKP